MSFVTAKNAILAVGGALVILPAAIALLIGIVVSKRRLLRKPQRTQDEERRLFGLGVGCYLGLGISICAVMPWARIFIASGLNWNRNDTEMIEVTVLSTPDPAKAAEIERRFNIADDDSIGRVFEELSSLKPHHPEHEQFIGATYILRQKRRSDGKWSRYQIELHEHTNSVEGAWIATIVLGTEDFTVNDGGEYESIGLGHFISGRNKEDAGIGKPDSSDKQ